ncbi:MAG: alpha/beta hydrolase [Devosia sp.]
MAFSRQRLWELVRATPRGPLAPLSQTVEPQAGFAIERLTFDVGNGVVARGIVTRPLEVAGRAPGILYMHAHGNWFDIGANELLAGDPAIKTPLGPVFAREGYVSLCLELPLFGTRATIGENALSKAMLWRGKTLIGQMLSELTGALGYLAGRPDVDAGRIGGFGLSMGSTHGFMLASLDDRIKALAHLCALADYDTMIELGAMDGHGQHMTIPGLLPEMSPGGIAGAIAPRPQFVGLGEEDALTPPAAVAKVRAEVEAAYRRAGHPEALEFFVQPGIGHWETPEMREKVLRFFRANL